MDRTLLFDVRGLTCDHCVHSVTEAAQGVDGVKAVKVELAAGTATVEGQFDESKVIEAIKEEGYEASVRS